MKTCPYIVINKNNMKQLQHFATADRVAAHLLGRKTSDILIVVKEYQVVNLGDLGDLGISDFRRIEKLLNEVSAALP